MPVCDVLQFSAMDIQLISSINGHSRHLDFYRGSRNLSVTQFSAQSMCAQNSWAHRHSCFCPALLWKIRFNWMRRHVRSGLFIIIKKGSLPVGWELGVLNPPGSMLFIRRASSGWLKRKKADWPKHNMHPARRENHVGKQLSHPHGGKPLITPWISDTNHKPSLLSKIPVISTFFFSCM